MISVSGPAPGFLRHPNHRIRVRPSRDRWRVRSGDVLIAESHAIKVLEETGYGAVIYFPAQALQSGALAPSKSETACPFKGRAHYFNLAAVSGGADVAWTYLVTYNEAKEIEGYVAFYADKVSIENMGNEQLKGNHNG